MSRAWMPLYIADYLADTTHLDCTESGAYLHLIMHYWQHGGLPNDDEKLARIAKAKHMHWIRMKPILRDFFDENWKHKRIDDELRKSSEISQGKREAANVRWSKRNANGYANASNVHMLRARASSQSQSHKDSFNGGNGKKRETAELVFVKEETEQWNAWTTFYRNSKRHSPGAISRKGTNERGWFFPSEWPPSPKLGALPEP